MQAVVKQVSWMNVLEYFLINKSDFVGFPKTEQGKFNSGVVDCPTIAGRCGQRTQISSTHTLIWRWKGNARIG